MKAKGPDEIEPLQFVQYLQSFLSYDQQINFCSQQCSTMQCTLYSLFATFFNSKASKKSTNTDRKISFPPWKSIGKAFCLCLLEKLCDKINSAGWLQS